MCRHPTEKARSQIHEEEARVQEAGNRSGHFRRAMPTYQTAWAAGQPAYCQDQEPARDCRGQFGRHRSDAGRADIAPATRVPEGGKQGYRAEEFGRTFDNEGPKLPGKKIGYTQETYDNAVAVHNHPAARSANSSDNSGYQYAKVGLLLDLFSPAPLARCCFPRPTAMNFRCFDIGSLSPLKDRYS